MNKCIVLPLDPGKRRAVRHDEPPAWSAMMADGVMAFPVERRQAAIHDCDELQERRQRRQARRA
jgi:hypothetical protein